MPVPSPGDSHFVVRNPGIEPGLASLSERNVNQITPAAVNLFVAHNRIGLLIARSERAVLPLHQWAVSPLLDLNQGYFCL